MKNIFMGFRSPLIKRRSGCAFRVLVCWFYCGDWFRSTSFSCKTLMLT